MAPVDQVKNRNIPEKNTKTNTKITNGTSNGTTMTKGKMDKNPNDSETAKTNPQVYIVFGSLLLDLLAFTMILPLLPSLLEYYRQNDDKQGLYHTLSESVKFFQQLVGAPDKYNSVLFGGFLGSMFSFLQFIASPIVGAISDCYGRKPVMLICMVQQAKSTVKNGISIVFFFALDWYCHIVWSLGNINKLCIICVRPICWRLKQGQHFVEYGHNNRCIDDKKSWSWHGARWNCIFIGFHIWSNDRCYVCEILR